MNHVDTRLDAALAMTFPASDPIAVSVPETPAVPEARAPMADDAGCSVGPPTDGVKNEGR